MMTYRELYERHALLPLENVIDSLVMNFRDARSHPFPRKLPIVMCRVVLVVIAIWVSQATAVAQTRSHGYVFGGAAGGSIADGAAMQIGGGWDKVWSKGFGIGIEGGYAGIDRSGVGTFSFNLAQQFHRASSRIVPFATGGISVINDAGGFNFGGGILYPFQDRLGLRVEFREHLVKSTCCNNLLTLSSFRVGLTFR